MNKRYQKRLSESIGLSASTVETYGICICAFFGYAKNQLEIDSISDKLPGYNETIEIRRVFGPAVCPLGQQVSRR